MIKRLIIALALGTGILFTANAQNSTVKDSLLRIYVTAPHDSMRLDLFSIDKVDITDPEAIGDVWPATRSIHIGLSLGI